MITRDALSVYLHDYLQCQNVDDYAPNGLQIEGKKTIQRICTAVTASFDAINKASLLEADALLVHHGYFWKGESPVIIGMKHQRIGRLIKQDISLFAYHLPLDCHMVVGNNACLGRMLGAVDMQQHAVGKTANLLWSGKLDKPISLDVLAQRVGEQVQRPPLCIRAQDKLIHSVAWCSGAAQDFIEEAHRLGVDAYLSGEISERTYYQAKEFGIHYLACGHHASERYGIQALGEHLANKFGVRHQFIDSDNPV